MAKIGIVGGGKGATLHADAVIHTRGVELTGVGGRPGSAEELAAVADAPDLSVSELCERSDALVVAVPPPEVARVVEAISTEIGRGASVRAVLVEPPLRRLPDVTVPLVLAANLLHAPVVRQALREIAAMHEPHHLQLRVRQPRPDWGVHGTPAFGGPLHDPGMRLAPVLLSAAAEPAVHVETTDVVDGAHAAIELSSGRRAGLEVTWAEGSSRIELEAADAGGVILLRLDPLPHLEIDGRAVETPDLHPLEALGFVQQIDRLARTAAGADAWPAASVAEAIEALFPTP